MQKLKKKIQKTENNLVKKKGKRNIYKQENHNEKATQIYWFSSIQSIS